ncbi:hypothetical protein [Vibrio phage vB_VmeM-Yong XC32]|nr:hypothetical protein [Vibrio phage vB_VmeM-Yong XC31]QAX96404.1 hypothetical protein [Vibrio phage vB_VmeM-Yong XC32]QAX96721.1 hypothetical protein [Vibrio phage vB_VmeM-Yong MS31]QAX97040.1 hypothetical protein [Vibrio phage vB_VmeM-Yong MS32]
MERKLPDFSKPIVVEEFGEYYPRGGVQDFRGSYNTLHMALWVLATIGENGYDRDHNIYVYCKGRLILSVANDDDRVLIPIIGDRLYNARGLTQVTNEVTEEGRWLEHKDIPEILDPALEAVTWKDIREQNENKLPGYVLNMDMHFVDTCEDFDENDMFWWPKREYADFVKRIQKGEY